MCNLRMKAFLQLESSEDYLCTFYIYPCIQTFIFRLNYILDYVSKQMLVKIIARMQYKIRDSLLIA